MLAQLFTSKTRIKLLLKLFLNPEVSCYLRELAKEFAISPNAIKEELDSLSQAGYLERRQGGRSIYFRANTNHPFFPEISSIVRKTMGIDTLIDQIMANLGRVEQVYILDDYAQGKDTGLIDVLVVGDVDREQLEALRQISERKINRTVRVLSMSAHDFGKSHEMFMARPHWRVV
ncbi:MAG: transcriptional regulator [Deltaproteobacteria bacterium HGW-Deltaproteobacteria-8]|jgi:DNA-binding transcriptional ArsR family regulator|nr:MAG: transcriptional regulator [Deltaproteobacteria bacterium HGW-Deltaproteobacteria-8]